MVLKTGAPSMAMNQQEREIKFTGAVSALSALPGCAFVEALTKGRGGWERLESRYYDTPEGDLAARGVSLRRRLEGAERFQTVKRVGADGLLAREEWEKPLAPGASFPALTGVADVDTLLGALGSRLKPTVEIDVDRWACAFPFRRSVIELSVDLGQARLAANGGAAAPLAEAELELVSGEAADLFAAAGLFLMNAPLRLHARSKLDTAKIAAGRESLVPGRLSLSVAAEDAAGDVLRRALIAVAERIITIQPAILETREPEGVHQMRVELRRLRAIERVFRRALPCDRLRGLAERAKMTASALGPARDWDVFIDETLPAAARCDYAPGGFARLKANAHVKRAEGWSCAVAHVGDEAFARFTLDLLEAAHMEPWRGAGEGALERPAAAFAAKALDRTWRKTCKVAETVDLDNLAARHPLRIALKKQRYAVQLFRGLYPKETRKPYMAAMSALQDAFGTVNDAVVAQGLANEAADGGGEDAMRAAGFICGFHAARAEAAAKEIDAAWAAFAAMTPFWRPED